MSWLDRIVRLLTRRGRKPIVTESAKPIIVQRAAAPQTSNTAVPDETGAFPRFQSSATDQLERGRTDHLARLRLKFRAAFTPSQPVADRRMFAGRLDAFAEMIRSIEDQRLHVIMYGDRGLGKTSMLRMLSQAAGNARYLVVYSSCGANSEFDDLFRASASEIPLRFHSEYGPTSPEAERGGSFADVFPEGALTPRQLTDLYAKMSGTRVLLILDEFDQCQSMFFRRDVAELIKSLSDRSVRVQLVIAGVASDLSELVQHIPSIRRNILPLRIPLMTEDEIRELVANGERAGGVTFEPDAAEWIVRAAHGSPYVASLLCHNAGLRALEAGSANVTVANVTAALDQALAGYRARVPAISAERIADMLAGAAAVPLVQLAEAALEAGGAFSAEFREGRRDTARKLAEHLADSGVLLSRAEDRGDTPRFRFSDEGAAQLIWMSSVGRQMQNGPRPVAQALS